MAPDVDSIGLPPRDAATQPPSATSSRRVSHSMAPPPVLGASGSATSRRGSMATSSPLLSATAVEALGASYGPVRHPRPLTAAELHLELEKEQEAVVNRLSRELSLLRQQTASVVSNTSSTSNAIQDGPEIGSGHTIPPPTHTTATRQHRSSSNLSSASASLSGLNTSTVSGIIPARDTAAQPMINARGRTSRHGSMNTRRPDFVSPSMPSMVHGDRSLVTSSVPSAPISPSIARSPHSQSSTPATPRIEEIAHYRGELENARRENDSLRRRVQELERELQRLNRSSRSEPPSEATS